MIKFGAKDAPARAFLARATAARDEGRFRDAAALYLEAIRLDPQRGGVHVQAGHMFKESGDYPAAERHYRAAAALLPDNADLALQFGHLYKLWGRLGDARAAYDRALALAPGWAAAEAELATFDRAGLRSSPESEVAAIVPPSGEVFDEELRTLPDGLKTATMYGRMAPENLPRRLREMLRYSHDSLNLRQFGVVQNSFWGLLRVARGVEPVRGFCISEAPLGEFQARVNGLPLHHGVVKGPYELEYEPDKTRIHKYVFHFWADFSPLTPGLYELEIAFPVAGEPTRYLREQFVVEPPLREEDYPDSDAIINMPSDFTGSLDDQINSRPSVIHLAERPNLLPEIRSILVMRADQLGDLVASIPGIYRLRELFPGAKLVGVFTAANIDLARTLNVFDDLVTLNFPESLYQRIRTMSLEDQEELRAKLAPFNFDIAIDLSQSMMSRPLLALSGAPFLYGFSDPNWPRLNASVDDRYNDPKNRREIATHSTRIMTMIDRLAALLKSNARIIRRDDLSRDALRAYGIGDDERYAVLHTGARIVFSRWPHYVELAAKLHAETDLKLVLFTGDPRFRESLPPELAASDRIVIIDGQLAFDAFDAILSYCAVYVGNDSGPKHLASLRGVPVVSIHSARINWSEWGQEHTGVIITRKLPCAGCHLYHDVDECGKEFVCITAIQMQEVYDAVRKYV